MTSVTLDIRAALTYSFRSRRWPVKLLIAACCILCSWLLLIPANALDARRSKQHMVAHYLSRRDAHSPAPALLPGLLHRDGAGHS